MVHFLKFYSCYVLIFLEYETYLLVSLYQFKRYAFLVNADGYAVFERPLTDTLINLELTLTLGERQQPARVISRVVDENGHYIGTYDENPILNTLMYNVKYSDDTVQEYTANTIM